LLLDLGGRDVPDILSPAKCQELLSGEELGPMELWRSRGVSAYYLWMMWSGTRPAQTSRRVAAAAATARSWRGRERYADGAMRVVLGMEFRVLGSG
jgi:hypothetical protein